MVVSAETNPSNGNDLSGQGQWSSDLINSWSIFSFVQHFVIVWQGFKQLYQVFGRKSTEHLISSTGFFSSDVFSLLYWWLCALMSVSVCVFHYHLFSLLVQAPFLLDKQPPNCLQTILQSRRPPVSFVAQVFSFK